MMKPAPILAALLVGGALLPGCARTTNLLSLDGPRFEGRYAAPAPALRPGAPFRVVTYNIRFAREIERAVAVLQSDSLRGADVIALQEMDEVGVERIARALGMNYAYYPASIHPANGSYFGPAVLSRWPIERSWKLLLPHAGWSRGQRRTATAALVRTAGAPLLVYAVHLETPVQISDAERRDQIDAVVRDAERHRGPVVIAGDFNSQGMGTQLEREGFTWPTERVGPTVAWFSWDHIFTRGLAAPRPPSAGVVTDAHEASDHRPVWAVVTVQDATARRAARSGSPRHRCLPGAAPRSSEGCSRSSPRPSP